MHETHRATGARPKKLIALLEAGQYEGEASPEQNPEHTLVIQAWNMVSDGTGSVDWAGVPIVAAMLGIEDLETFIRRLMTIKHHRPGESNDEPPKRDDDGIANPER